MLEINSHAKHGLRIIIVGCGKVGSTLVAKLSKEGHDITIIDKNPNKIQTLAGQFDVMGICGNGASYSTQKEAGIDDSDLIIAVTESDELNLLCCAIAKQATECAAIARVRTPDYNDDIRYLREKFGLALIINPELEAATEIARVLYLPSALEISSFAHGQAVLVNFKIPEGNILDGMRLIDLGKRISHNILVCAVERNGEVIIPSGTFRLAAGDVISIVGRRIHSKNFLHSVGFTTKQVKNTLIVGGGTVAFYLAEQLINMNIDVKIIEQDIKRCEELSLLLPKAIIINGDGTDEELLLEEGIIEAESFVPLTGFDEENIMLTLYAKQVSDAKVITKINRISFHNVINKLDLGSVAYPKFITSEAIVAYVRARQASKDRNSIETLSYLFGARVEAIEFIANEDFPCLDVMLKDLSLKKNLLISLINRKGTAFIPGGLDCLKVGDTVIIVTTNVGYNELTDILDLD